MTAIVSKNIRVRYPEHFEVGEYSIIDDWGYFSTRFRIGRFFHVAASVTVAGGSEQSFVAGDFGGLASGVRVFCATDHFVHDIGNVLPSWCEGIKNRTVKGDVRLDNFCTIGANSVVLPGVHLPTGCMIGAMSFVASDAELEPWTVYAGYPKLRRVGQRNKENVLRQYDEVIARLKARST